MLMLLALGHSVCIFNRFEAASAFSQRSQLISCSIALQVKVQCLSFMHAQHTADMLLCFYAEILQEHNVK